MNVDDDVENVQKVEIIQLRIIFYCQDLHLMLAIILSYKKFRGQSGQYEI